MEVRRCPFDLQPEEDAADLMEDHKYSETLLLDCWKINIAYRPICLHNIQGQIVVD